MMKKQPNKTNQKHIYRVLFKESPFSGEGEPAGKTEFFFSSLSAIYDIFSAEKIGCKVSRLWNLKITPESPYNGRKCTITKEPISGKKRTSKK